MKDQNLKNHVRLIPLYHYVLFLLVLAALVLAVINLFNGINIPSVLFLLISASVGLGTFYMRYFALKAQDRAIRAEENLRYFAMTGKLLDKDLRMSQIIALRFADDAEFIELVDLAVKEKMGNKRIKQSIRNWKGDYDRV